MAMEYNTERKKSISPQYYLHKNILAGCKDIENMLLIYTMWDVLHDSKFSYSFTLGNIYFKNISCAVCHFDGTEAKTRKANGTKKKMFPVCIIYFVQGFDSSIGINMNNSINFLVLHYYSLCISLLLRFFFLFPFSRLNFFFTLSVTWIWLAFTT